MICFRYFSRQRYDLASRNANILAICQVKKTKRRGKKDDTATCMEAYFLHNSFFRNYFLYNYFLHNYFLHNYYNSLLFIAPRQLNYAWRYAFVP